MEQNRHLARMRQASRQALRVWKLPLILLLKAACLWSCIFACVCSHSLCIRLPWPTLLTIRYLIYIYIFLLPHRVCCHWLSAMPAQHMKAPEQAREDTSPAKIDVTSKSPVGDISVVTLIRTDTTLDHSQKAEKDEYTWLLQPCAHVCPGFPPFECIVAFLIP